MWSANSSTNAPTTMMHAEPACGWHDLPSIGRDVVDPEMGRGLERVSIPCRNTPGTLATSFSATRDRDVW